MLTIIEGPDCAGKSTLLDAITSRAFKPLQTRHSEPDAHLSARQKYVRYLSWIRRSFVDPMWCDRAWLSCLIYDPVMTGKSRLTGHHRRVLERLSLSAEVVQVICLPHWEVCRDQWSKRAKKGAEYVEQEAKFRQIYDLYYEEVFRGRLPTIGYNYVGGGEKTVLDLLPAIRSPMNLGPGIGNYQQGVTLLVSDRPNTNAGPFLGPFCALTGCSPWLSEQLDSDNVSELSLYWVNAYDENGRGTDPSFIEDLEPQKIIAIGSQAQEWCHYHNLGYDQVEHPQAWKRSRSGERYPLLDLIKHRTQKILKVEHERVLH